jgi:RNA polymerase sigma factor for flagellar operon FliA
VPDTTLDELWLRWKEAADPEARDRLLLHYAPLVKFVAGRLRSELPASVEQADLVSDGLIGLMDAMDKFDLGRGFQFQTYAVARIRGAIVDGLRAIDWVPRTTRDRIRAHDRAGAELEHRLGRTPTTDEMAAELGVDPGLVRRTRHDGARTGMVQLQPDDMAVDPMLDARGSSPGEDGVLPVGFSDAVRTLRERDQIVLALYYWEGFTLVEIGRVLGVGESRVSQLHTRATAALREALPSGE